MKKFLFKSFASIMAGMVIMQSMGVFASSATVDTSFGVGAVNGFKGAIRNMVVQNDGKTIIVGEFTSYKGISANKIIRLNADETVDTSFAVGIGFNGLSIQSVTLQTDGKILIGGDFTTYQGLSANRIIRLNTDGSRDNSFNIGSGFDGHDITTIKIQTDGKILIGGDFYSYNGIRGGTITRLNSDGSIDNSFILSNNSRLIGKVEAFTIQNDGKIVVAAYHYDSQKTYITRLNSDGSIDNDFGGPELGNDGGLFSNVHKFIIDSNNNILVVGAFTNIVEDGSTGGYCSDDISPDQTSCEASGLCSDDISPDQTSCEASGLCSDSVSPDQTSCEDVGEVRTLNTRTSNPGVRTNGSKVWKMIRLNSDGSRDNSFSPLQNYDQIRIDDALIQDDGKIIVGGDKNIRLNTDGSIDDSRDNAYTSMLGSQIIMNNSADIVIGDRQGRYFRVNTNGTEKYTTNLDGFNGEVNTTALQNDGKVIVGGSFTIYKGLNANRIIRLNSDGSRDNSFNIGSGFDNLGGNGKIKTISIQNDGKVIIGGYFSTYQGSSANRIIRLNTDGSRDNSFNIGSGFDSDVYIIRLQNDGKIIVGGFLNIYKGVAAYKLIRLNSDGSLDNSFTNSTSFTRVSDFGIQNDGKIVVGGRFAKGIVRLNSDGSKDNSFNIGNGFNGDVNTIGLQNDGEIVVGGTFTNYNGINVNHIVCLNTDGSIDNSFNIGGGFDIDVNSISIESGNQMILGGRFTTYKGLPANHIIELNSDGSRDTSFNLGLGFDGDVNSITKSNSGNIVIGGDFTTYNGVPAGKLVSLYGDSPVVDLPASSEQSVVNAAFLAKGYTQSNGDFLGTTPISLANTNGSIPVDLSIQNINVTVTLDANTQLKQTDATTNYNGLLSVPTTKSISSINDEAVISSFKVGSSSESITLAGGLATISLPTVGQAIGQAIQISYSNDNGVSWYPELITQVIDKNGTPTVEFSTNHFADFALTLTADTISPVGTISYNTTGSTDNDVIATLNVNEPATITNNNRLSSYTFTDNGSFTFEFTDTSGNTGSTTATVNWIDKTVSNNTGSSQEDSNSGGGSSSSSSSSSSYHNIIPSIIDEVGELLHGAAEEKIGSITNSRYPTESNNAYLWAYKMGITTMPTIQKANIEGKLYRSHLAKMLSEYAVNQLKKTANTGTICEFTDMANQTTEMKIYAQAACQLGLMGLKADGTPDTKFNPTGEVTRAQFGTTLSRLLYGASNNEVVGGQRYTAHLQALKKAGIMTKIDKPTMEELRGNVFLMLMRSVK